MWSIFPLSKKIISNICMLILHLSFKICPGLIGKKNTVQCTNYAVLETCPNPIRLLRQYLLTLIRMLLTPSLVLLQLLGIIFVWRRQKHNWDACAQLTCRAQRTDAQLGLGLRWQLVADEGVASHNYLLNPDSPLPLWASRHNINALSIITINIKVKVRSALTVYIGLSWLSLLQRNCYVHQKYLPVQCTGMVGKTWK